MRLSIISLLFLEVENLHLIDEIPIEFPNDFEAYDPQLIDKSFTSKNGISGKRIFEHLLIPRYQGTYTIPAVDFIYFNTKNKKYETIQTISFDIQVKKGKDDGGGSYRSTEELKQSKNIFLHDIKKTASWQKKDSYDLISIWWYWLFILVPVISVIILSYTKNWKKKIIPISLVRNLKNL